MQSLQDVSGLGSVKGTSTVVMVYARLVLQAKRLLPLPVPTPTLCQYTCSRFLSHSFTLTVGSQYSLLHIYTHIYIVVLRYPYNILLPCQTNCPGRNFTRNEWKSHGQDGPSSSASI